jgi:hypothetical protein
MGVVIFVLGMLINSAVVYIGLGVIALGLAAWWLQERRCVKGTDKS